MRYRFHRLQRLCFVGIACAQLILAQGVSAATAAADALAGTPEDRIVAIGDVHGALTELETLLHALGLIDGDGNWSGGRTRLVSLGDLLDRGPESRRVLDLLMRLERQSAAAGGALHLVLGNHEIMNLTGDLRYVSRAEYAAFAADEDPAVRERARAEYLERATRAAESAVAREADTGVQSADTGPADPAVTFEQAFPPGFFGHRAAFAADGSYGSWLLDKPQVLVLERIAFVHGGLSEALVTSSISEYNRRSAADLRQLLDLGERLVRAGALEPWQDLLTAGPAIADAALPEELVQLRETLQFADDGPSWYRGTAACHPILERPRFETMLAALGLERVVMGHTPTFPRIIQTRFDGRAVLTDTGLYAAYYHGRPAAAVFGGDEPRYLSLAESGSLERRSGRPLVDVRAEGSGELENELSRMLSGTVVPRDGKPVVLEADDRRQLAWYREGNRRQNRQQLAAWSLDRLLGLGLVAPVIAADGADQGVYDVMPAGAFSEVERLASARYRPNWCQAGSDYDLMYVLDTLIGIDVRAAETVHYDPATWLIYLTGHQDAFPTWQRLPRYLAERVVTIPVLLAERLASLSADTLEDTLGSYLNDRQRRALLARRDLMLATWPVGQ